jgi:hypothetical protein
MMLLRKAEILVYKTHLVHHAKEIAMAGYVSWVKQL